MKHTTDSEIRRFHAHTLSSGEEMLLLNHMAKCDFCAGRLANALPEKELLTPPPDLFSNILEAAKRIPSRKEKRREFYHYSTKVVLAMGMALSLLAVCSLSDGIPIITPSGSSSLQHSSQSYLNSLQKQEAKRKNMEEQKEKFLQEKQEEEERKKEWEKNSGKISAGLKDFSSSILSCFKSEQKEESLGSEQ